MSREKYRTLNEVWPDGITSGVFASLQNLNVPWKSENISQVLDVDYFYNHSGKKIVSNLLDNFAGAEGTITEAQKTTIATLLYVKYGESWRRLWEAMIHADYNPIWNTDATITEKGNDNTTGVQSGTNKTAHTGNDTHTNSGTDNVASSGSDTLTKTGKNGEVHTGSDITTKAGNDTNTSSGSDSVKMTGTDAHALTGSDTNTVNGTENVTDSLKVTNTTDGDSVVYHHDFKTQHNDNTHGNKCTTITSNQVYGYNSSDPADSNKQIVTADNAIIERTTNGEKSENGALTDAQKAWNNSDITDDDRKLTEQHSGGNKTTNDSTTTTVYGKTDTETVDRNDTTTYGKIDTMTHDTTDTLQHGEDISFNYDTSDVTSYGKSDNRTLDITNKDIYNSNEDVTIDITNTSNGEHSNETTRQGNIGVTTTQQMITEEITLRVKYQYFNEIFKMIDEELTIPVY